MSAFSEPPDALDAYGSGGGRGGDGEIVRVRGVARYRDYLTTELGLADRTVDLYVAMVERAAAWCEDEGLRLPSLRGEDARRFADTLVRSRPTRERARSALMHYWEMLGRADRPDRAIRVPSQAPGRYRGFDTDDEAAALVGAALRFGFPAGTAVLCGMLLALRREEIASLRWGDFEPDLSWVRVWGKGDRLRELPVHELLRRQLVLCRNGRSHVFPGQRGRLHVHPYTVQTWLNRVLGTVDVPRITPHQMRHTALATINDTTRDMRTAQVFAGHARIATTQIYTRTTRDRMVEAMRALDRVAPRQAG